MAIEYLKIVFGWTPLWRAYFSEEILIFWNWTVDGNVSLKVERNFGEEDFECLLVMNLVFDLLSSFLRKNEAPIGLIEKLKVYEGFIDIIQFFNHLIVNVPIFLEFIVSGLRSVSSYSMKVHHHESWVRLSNILDLFVRLIPLTKNFSELSNS